MKERFQTFLGKADRLKPSLDETKNEATPWNAWKQPATEKTSSIPKITQQKYWVCSLQLPWKA